MKIVTAAALVLVLAGCAKSDANIYGSFIGQRIIGNKNYVTIWNVWNEMDALPLADRHCSTFGRSAQFNKMERNRAVFNCVE